MHIGFKITPLIIAGAIVVLLGLICDGIIIARFSAAPQSRVGPKPWGLRALAIGTLLLTVLFAIANIFYASIAALLHRKHISQLTELILPVELLLRIATLVGFAEYFRRHRFNLRQVLGLDTIHIGAAVGWGVVFCLASLPPVGVIMFATDVFCRLFQINVGDQPVVDLFLKTNSPALLLVLLLFALSVAPVFEEFFFRGFAYPALKQRYGFWPALLLVSGIFAFSHLHAPSFLPLFVFAIGLGLAYELTGSLIAPITMHILFNATMIVQLFYQRSHP